MSDTPLVNLARETDIGVITVNYPPVNALGPGVAEDIIECLKQSLADPAITAMVLIGDGRSFIAGADIRGFGTGRKRLPLGERIYDILDAAANPWSPRSTATRSAAAWRSRSPATTASPCLREGRPAGGPDRHPARWRRHAAAATAGRSASRAGHDHLRPPRPGAGSGELGILDEVMPESAGLRDSAIAYARSIAAARPLPRVRDHDRQGQARTSSMRCANPSPGARATKRRHITASPPSRPPAHCRSITASVARANCSRNWKTPTRQTPCVMPSSPNARSRNSPTCRRKSPPRHSQCRGDRRGHHGRRHRHVVRRFWLST